MSYYALFGSVVQRLRRSTWGTQIQVDGQQHDTAVDPPIQEIAEMLSDTGAIDLADTLSITNSGLGAALAINSTSSNSGISVTDSTGNTGNFTGINGITAQIPFVGASLDPAHPDTAPIIIKVDTCKVTATYTRKVLEVSNGFVTKLSGG